MYLESVPMTSFILSMANCPPFSFFTIQSAEKFVNFIDPQKDSFCFINFSYLHPLICALTIFFLLWGKKKFIFISCNCRWKLILYSYFFESAWSYFIHRMEIIQPLGNMKGGTKSCGLTLVCNPQKCILHISCPLSVKYWWGK